MSLKNDDFRRLLSTMPRRADGSAATPLGAAAAASKPASGAAAKRSGGGAPGKRKYHPKKRDDDEDNDDLDRKESQQHLTEIMKSYRDRAAERRKADSKHDADEAAISLMLRGIAPDASGRNEVTVEQSKLLGGDIEHTHMVRGLDYTLLEKSRVERKEEIHSDEDEEDESLISAPPEKVAQNPMVRRLLRSKFHTTYPKVNEHFAPGRMAYVCNFDEEMTNEVPSTLIRSYDAIPKENPAVKTDRLILEQLTNILSYLPDKKRKDKKKKKMVAEDETESKSSGAAPSSSSKRAADDTNIFDDVGTYDTKAAGRRDERRDSRPSRSYFDDDRRRSDRDRDRDRRRHRRSPSLSPSRKDKDRSRDRDRDDRGKDRERERDRDRQPKEKDIKQQVKDVVNNLRKRATSPQEKKASTGTAEPKKKRMAQDDAYGEYYMEDMDFVETIADEDDDDDQAIALARARMRQELGTDGTEKKLKRANQDRKKQAPGGGLSKADVQRKLDSELKKMDEVWTKQKKQGGRNVDY